MFHRMHLGHKLIILSATILVIGLALGGITVHWLIEARDLLLPLVTAPPADIGVEPAVQTTLNAAVAELSRLMVFLLTGMALATLLCIFLIIVVSRSVASAVSGILTGLASQTRQIESAVTHQRPQDAADSLERLRSAVDDLNRIVHGATAPATPPHSQTDRD